MRHLSPSARVTLDKTPKSQSFDAARKGVRWIWISHAVLQLCSGPSQHQPYPLLPTPHQGAGLRRAPGLHRLGCWFWGALTLLLMPGRWVDGKGVPQEEHWSAWSPAWVYTLSLSVSDQGCQSHWRAWSPRLCMEQCRCTLVVLVLQAEAGLSTAETASWGSLSWGRGAPLRSEEVWGSSRPALQIHSPHRPRRRRKRALEAEERHMQRPQVRI